MFTYEKVMDGIYWLGGNDFITPRFDNEIPIPYGITYNSYFIDDEKTAVVDSVDNMIRDQFMTNLRELLHGRALDYVIVNHMEPDHSGSLLQLLEAYPEAKLVASPAAVRMFEQYFHSPMADRYVKVNEKMELSLGKRTLKFINAPMVHWPEVTFTYDETDKVLFSADAFGTFGVLHGSIFSSSVDYREVYLPELRRYYANIMMRYGMSVKNVAKKLEALSIDRICPLHGPVLDTKEDMELVISSMLKWASFEPEKESVAVFFASAYGHTAQAAQHMAALLNHRGVKDTRLIDLCKTPVSFALPYVLSYSHIVLAAPTYNMGIFPNMETFLHALLNQQVMNRKFAIISNGSWTKGISSKLMREIIGKFKNSEILGDDVLIMSDAGDKEEESLAALADVIAKDVLEK